MGNERSERVRSPRWGLATEARVEAAVVGLVAAAIVVVVGVWGWVGAPVDAVEGCDDIVAFELAVPGEPPAPLQSIDTLAACGRTGDAHHPELRDAIRTSVLRDAAFIAVYGPLLFLLAARLGGWRGWLGWRPSRPWRPWREPPPDYTPRLADITSTYHGRIVATLAKWSVVAAVVLDVVENVLLWRTAGRLGSPDDVVVSLTAGAAIGKFVLLVLPVGMGLHAFGRLIAAGIRSPRPDKLVGHVVAAGADEARRWDVPVRGGGPGDELTSGSVDNADDRYGIALSGGGIRSATFALGGLQVLDALPETSRWQLRRADYVSAVSGGSYMASAYQFLAMQRVGRNLARYMTGFGADAAAAAADDADDEPPTAAPPYDQLVKPAGDVESHFRRHSMHLADGAAEWVMAIGEIAVKAVSGLVLLLLSVWAVGLPVGWLFRYVLHGVDADGQPAPSIDLRIVAVPLFAYVVLASIQWVAAGADHNKTRSSAAGRTVLSRDGARQTTLFALALTASLAIALPFLAANIERSVDAVTNAIGLTDSPDEPSRADVLAHLATTIDGAAAAADGASSAAGAVAAVDPAAVSSRAERDALDAATTAAELAASYAEDATRELAALVDDADASERFPLAGPFDPAACTDDADLPNAAAEGDRTVAFVACRAASAAAGAARAATAVVETASSTPSAREAAAKAASGAAKAAAGATKAGNAVIALGNELDGVHPDDDGEDPPIAWAGLATLATAVGGIVGKRKLATTKATEAAARPKSDLTRKLGFGGRLEVLAGIMAVAVLVIALSDVVVDAWQRGASGPMKLVFEADAWVWWLASVAALALAYLIVNVNVWSLRPFYHRRLWLPYAVTPDGNTADWWTEARLSIVGRKLDDFPELLICAAAQTSGRDMAPPGRRALPFVFSAEACGGPELGYVSTDTLETVLRRQRRQPITLFGAMATSGAAFGPAMGRHSKGGLGAVMAIANARLGAWLPNPRHLTDVVRDGIPFRASSLATWPRLSYWVREIIGQYPADAKLTLVTDGGHVENLGLLELLRRRCTRIVCLDASGAGATPTTLAEAIALAREELGVEITLRIPGEGDIPLIDLEFGADPLRRKLDADGLAGRIAAHPVLEGTVFYPAVGGQPECEGRLLYGTLALAGTDPADWDVLEYAQRNPLFPNDGTDQQWFRADTFTAYQQLGRRTVERLLDVADA